MHPLTATLRALEAEVGRPCLIRPNGMIDPEESELIGARVRAATLRALEAEVGRPCLIRPNGMIDPEESELIGARVRAAIEPYFPDFPRLFAVYSLADPVLRVVDATGTCVTVLVVAECAREK